MTRSNSPVIGVLAIQGDFERHLHQIALESGVGREVRLPRDLDGLDGIILPGGESTTMSLLLDRFSLRQPLRDFASSMPVWGTCAGMILLSRTIRDNQAGVLPFGLLDVEVERNGYGRQFHSFEALIEARLDGRPVRLQGAFIRAPRICSVAPTVSVLARHNADPILVTQNRIMASSFHTELDDDTTLLRFFLKNCLAARGAGRI